MNLRKRVLGRLTKSASDGVMAKVREFGWTIVYVDDKPAFGYTVGLGPTLEHAELIVVGLPEEATSWVLHGAVDHIRAGESLLAGSSVAGLIGDFDAFILRVGDEHLGKLAFAGDVYGALDFEALQIVWPDRDGKLPWQSGADPRLADGQPVLGPTT